MKHILVPFDFSVHAINAYRFALAIAGKANATIHVLQVIELPTLITPALFPVYNFEDPYLKEWKEKNDLEFLKLKRKYKSDGINIISHVIVGKPSAIILSEITIQSVDLIIMGSHGASGFVDFFLGSNTEKIVHQSPVPVLVIKDYVNGTIKNIVFPVTLETEHQDRLVEKIKLLQQFFNARLHVVFINTPLNFSSDETTYAKLTAFAIRYGLTNYTLDVYNHLEREEGIRQFTKKLKGDLITIGASAHGGIAHLVNGSLAEHVTHHADVPVWTYSLKTKTDS